MQEEWMKMINELSEEDAKSLLLSSMLRVNRLAQYEHPTKEMIDEVATIQEEGLKRTQRKNEYIPDYEVVHLVSGESSAGSLRVGLGRKNRVIGVPGTFAIGPVHQLPTKSGLKRRYEWLRDHLNIPDKYMEEEYLHNFSRTIEEIKHIPAAYPIVIWTADNADEQTSLRYFLHLLHKKENDIFVINTTKAFQQLFNTKQNQYYYFATGQTHPDKLRQIYEELPGEPLSEKEKVVIKKEWNELSASEEVLRIWENNKIVSEDERFFDQMIIDTAKRLHQKQPQKDFVKAPRIIGEVYGRINNNVGDVFIEYRLRSLVYAGVFEIKGVPKSMRHYSVKLVS